MLKIWKRLTAAFVKRWIWRIMHHPLPKKNNLTSFIQFPLKNWVVCTEELRGCPCTSSEHLKHPWPYVHCAFSVMRNLVPFKFPCNAEKESLWRSRLSRTLPSIFGFEKRQQYSLLRCLFSVTFCSLLLQRHVPLKAWLKSGELSWKNKSSQNLCTAVAWMKCWNESWLSSNESLSCLCFLRITWTRD